jgi:hypothetical protein
VNQQERAKREKEKYLEKKAKILTIALKEGDDGKTRGQKGGSNRREQRNSLGKNQCAYCKEERHECPNKKKKKEKE